VLSFHGPGPGTRGGAMITFLCTFDVFGHVLLCFVISVQTYKLFKSKLFKFENSLDFNIVQIKKLYKIVKGSNSKFENCSNSKFKNCSNLKNVQIIKLFKLENSSNSKSKKIKLKKCSGYKIVQIQKLFKLEKSLDFRIFQNQKCSNLKIVQT
jgi:hypothetical protein